MSNSIPFQPMCMTAEDLPPDDEMPPDLTADMWSLILFVATPADLRDIDWVSKDQDGREKINTLAAWCRSTGVHPNTAGKWMTDRWYQHYLGLVLEQRSTHDYMHQAMMERLYLKGMDGDQRAMKQYLDFAGEAKPTHAKLERESSSSISPSRMSDEELDRMLEAD